MSEITRIDLPSARHGAAMARHGRRPSPAPATRPFMFFTRHGLSRSPAARHSFWSEPAPPTMLFTRHESRITNHGFYAFLAAYLQVVARHGAAMARHGRPPSPRTGNKACMVFTNHGFSAFYVHRPSAISPGANQTPNHGFHESRDTKHESRLFFESQLPYPRFPTISRHFPPFPAPPTPLRRSRSASPRAPSAAAPAASRQARKRIAART